MVTDAIDRFHQHHGRQSSPIIDQARCSRLNRRVLAGWLVDIGVPPPTSASGVRASCRRRSLLMSTDLAGRRCVKPQQESRRRSPADAEGLLQEEGPAVPGNGWGTVEAVAHLGTDCARSPGGESANRSCRKRSAAIGARSLGAGSARWVEKALQQGFSSTRLLPQARVTTCGPPKPHGSNGHLAHVTGVSNFMTLRPS